MVVILNHALVALYLYYRDRTRFAIAEKPAAPNIGSDSGGLDSQMGIADGVQVGTICVFVRTVLCFSGTPGGNKTLRRQLLIEKGCTYFMLYADICFRLHKISIKVIIDKSSNLSCSSRL